MHKIHEKEFTIDDFSHEHCLDNNMIWMTIAELNEWRTRYLKTKDKTYWWQMIQLLPSSYNQTRNVMLNYEALANIYKSRKDHKLDEWREFCKWIESLPYSDLIVSTSSGCKNKVNKSDIRWAEDIFKNRGIKLTEAQIDAINSSGCKNKVNKSDIRWAEDIFKNHGIKLTEAQIDAINSSGCKNKVNKSDIRWAEDIFKNHGIKLTEAQIDAINSIGTTNIITSEEMVNGIDSDTMTDAAVDYAVQMAKDAARHYSFEKEE